MAWADLDGDGLPELLVAEPDSGQLTVYFQQADGSLGAPKTFPTLTGVSDIAVADWDGDGRAEIFLLSADERQAGVTQLDRNGRIAFPKILPTDGRPLALAVGPLQAGAKPALALILEKDDKRELQVRWEDGSTRSQKLNENFKSNPTTLAFHDVNQDGLNDLVVLTPYEKIKVLLQVPDKPFDEQDIAPPGGSAEQPWMSTADVDGDGKPELLLAQKNFLRAVVWQEETNSPDGKPTYSFRVKDQINGAGSNSRIVGAAALPNGTNRIGSLFLLDAERKSLTLCERDPAGVWQVVRNLPLPVSDFSSLRAVALGYPETYEEQPWGDRVVKVKGKIFFFCGVHEKRLYATVKLPRSGRALLKRDYAEPTHYGMGKHGWVTVHLDRKKKPTMDLIEAWLDESYRAVAPKKMVAQL